MSLHGTKIVSSRLIAKSAMICCAASLLAGCMDIGATNGTGAFRPSQEKVALLPAEECAIGYDLAKQVYNLVQVTKTVIIVSPKLGDCGEHAVKYLRKAGYAVDETATQSSAHQFSIATYEDKETGSVFATAYLPGLKLTRGYKRGEIGMYPLTPVDVVYEDKL
jgi:hypothetical protein